MRLAVRCVPIPVVLAALAPSLRAQWATFVDQTSTRLVATPALGATDPQEKDYAFADFDQDGDTDLVCVRKQPATSTGHFPNVLFMNEAGVLTDRTQQYASASLVAASQGMLDSTNDRDVVAVDVNGDGWIDLVTCTTLTVGQPQYIRVPRVYVNRGDDLAGNWQGFLYDDPLRIDDMAAGTSWNGEHRFCAVAAGDVDNDGDQDLFFGDYDRGTVSIDVNDRLLLNNGAGWFTDVTATHLPGALSQSNFVTRAVLTDFDLDGRLDIGRNNVSVVDVTYNDGPGGPGHFQTRQQCYAGAAYHFNAGDLNNDNLPDLVISDDGQDRFVLHTGVAGGVATWGATQAFSYIGGGADDGFGSTSHIVDLNNDGWRDVLITDFDVDVTGCARRTHIFRNLGNAPNVSLQEQMVGNAVCGIPVAELAGTFDIAVFDIDGDGWKDMVVGRCTGTQVWMNVPPAGVAFSYPNGLLPAFTPVNAPQTVDVQATATGTTVLQPGSGRVHWSVNGAAWQQAPMLALGGGLYRAVLPVLPNCTDNLQYYVSVDDATATTWRDPPAAPAGAYATAAGVGMATIYETGFEAPVDGWQVVNTNLAAGAWEIATPNFTISGSQLAAPHIDAENSPGTTKCWLTMNGPVNGSAALYDVDGGPTDLISPPLYFAGSDGFISYRRWYFSSTVEDRFEVAVSGDGVNWVPVESVVGWGNNQWLQRSFRVGSYITPTAGVRVRFRVSDNPNNSVVEAAIDVFKAEVFTCTPCQQEIALATSGQGRLSVCGGSLATTPVVTMLAVSLPQSGSGLLLFDLPLLPTPWAGGALLSPAPIVLGPIQTDANGVFAALLPIGGLLPPGFALHTQVVYDSAPLPFGFGQTNVVKLQW
ncbi:MAG: VCBS repeat-containing protein [Planctomycetes bacterium]|nr:VCBS repeat-containing protein [Planctomycetota bacterium]